MVVVGQVLGQVYAGDGLKVPPMGADVNGFVVPNDSESEGLSFPVKGVDVSVKDNPLLISPVVTGSAVRGPGDQCSRDVIAGAVVANSASVEVISEASSEELEVGEFRHSSAGILSPRPVVREVGEVLLSP